MEKKKLNCHDVRYFLPAYAANMTNAEGNKVIYEHLEECKECSEIYDHILFCTGEKRKEPGKRPEYLDYLKRIKDFLFRKAVLGSAVVLFVFMRFMAVFFNIISFAPYEAEFYVLLVSVVCLFTWKDLFHWERKGNKRFSLLYVLHIVIFIISVAAAYGMYRIIGVKQWEIDFLYSYLGPVGPFISMVLYVMMTGLAVIMAYGMYASVKKSGQYYSLVCHGLGSLVMLCSLLYTLRMLDLTYGYSSQIIIYHLIPYAEGIILSVFYCFYCIYYMHKLKKTTNSGDRAPIVEV